MRRLLVRLFFAFQLKLEDRFVERIEEAGGLEVVNAGQVTARSEPEVRQEFLRGRVKQRTSGSLAAARGAQPASMSTSSVPLEICTPRMPSISALLTGS